MILSRNGLPCRSRPPRKGRIFSRLRECGLRSINTKTGGQGDLAPSKWNEGYPRRWKAWWKVSRSQQVDKKVKFLRRIPLDPMTAREWGKRSMQDDPSPTLGGQNVFDVYTNSMDKPAMELPTRSGNRRAASPDRDTHRRLDIGILVSIACHLSEVDTADAGERASQQPLHMRRCRRVHLRQAESSANFADLVTEGYCATFRSIR